MLLYMREKRKNIEQSRKIENKQEKKNCLPIPSISFFFFSSFCRHHWMHALLSPTYTVTSKIVMCHYGECEWLKIVKWEKDSCVYIVLSRKKKKIPTKYTREKLWTWEIFSFFRPRFVWKKDCVSLRHVGERNE